MDRFESDLQTGLFLPEEVSRGRNTVVRREEGLARLLENHPELNTKAYIRTYWEQFEPQPERAYSRNGKPNILGRGLGYAGRLVPPKARPIVAAGAAALALFGCNTGTATPVLPSQTSTSIVRESTPAVTSTPEQDLIKERASLHPDAYNEFDSLFAEVKTDGVTSKERDGVIAVVKDPKFKLVTQNDDLTSGLKLAHYPFLYNEFTAPPSVLVDGIPYAQKLEGLIISSDPSRNVSRAWNYKVKKEHETLCILIPESQPGYDCNSQEAKQFRWDNGSYRLQLWLDGNSIVPLSMAGIEEVFEKEEDAEIAFVEGFWVPLEMYRYNLTQWKWYGQPRFSNLRDNMDVYLGKKKINAKGKQELPFANLRSRIVSVQQDHTLDSYLGNFGNDYENATVNWRRQTHPVVIAGLENVPQEYREHFVPILDKEWKDFELIKLAYGLAVSDMHGLESSDVSVAALYINALGGTAFQQFDINPNGTGSHQYLAHVIPKRILPLLPERKLVFPGQLISPYSALDGLIEDKVPSVNRPGSREVIWTYPAQR
ncbi:MAG: hypothetical protein HYS62_00285 [Candidatus Aenigmarchaeota archaeon]|nr:hypothetical protein [Candidatus Aenigmarchaeota archaeon]